MKKAITWISRMLSEGDGTPSTKRVCFFGATFACVIFAAGHILKTGLDGVVVGLLQTIMVTTGSAYGVSRFAEYGKGEPPTP